MTPTRVWNRACLKGGFERIVLLTPLHYGLPEICWHLERYIERCDKVLGIMGPYWSENWERGPFAHWKPKITPLDMAVDVANYPRVKRRFRPPGQRKFLFIGTGAPYKGVHLLSILFGRAAGRHHCVWIAADRDLPYLELRPPMSFSGAALEALAQECDVFLTMGVSDANPTTILEAMAWGFPVACTPQSGYHNVPVIRSLSTTDMEHNLSILDAFQNAPEEELMAQADEARRLVELDYTFEKFTNTVLGALRELGMG